MRKLDTSQVVSHLNHVEESFDMDLAVSAHWDFGSALTNNLVPPRQLTDKVILAMVNCSNLHVENIMYILALQVQLKNIY